MNNSDLNPIETYTGNVLRESGTLEGTVSTIVYAHNYNELSNKPSINSVTLQGNKTAADLGLAVPSDIPVQSVNGQTGDIILTGSDIDYSSGISVNAKINDLESQIVGSGVTSVNGQTGAVTLSGDNLNYSAGVTINDKIDAVEGSIPVVDYPVTSVNGQTGDVNITVPVQSVNGQTGAISLTANDVPLTTNPTDGTTKEAIDEVNNNKANKSSFTRKSYATSSPFSINANSIDTRTISVNNATYGIIAGFAITGTNNVTIMQCFFNSTTDIQIRVRNNADYADTYSLTIFYI